MASMTAIPAAARPSGTALRSSFRRSHARRAGASRRSGGMKIAAKLTVPPTNARASRPASYNSKLFSVASGDDAKRSLEPDEIPEEVAEVVRTRARNRFKPGLNLSAENWNGRLAMVGVVFALAIEYFSGQGPLNFFGILG